MKPIAMVIVGAGGRGQGYAHYACEHPDEAKVVGVVEPVDCRRDLMVKTHGIPARNVFSDWKACARRKRFADAAVICTQDTMHAGPAVALAKKGYHVLLEKPMAPTACDCRRIVKAALDARIIFAVCHVMRYTAYTRKLKEIIDSGAIGEVVSVQHLEPVGYWHQAHAFVRGKWASEKTSSPMLLAKSCHDVDWLRYIVGARCVSVSSFGSLKHFRKEEAPAGAAPRCLDCPVEPTCPYSAKKIYLGRVARGHKGWPVDVLVDGEVTVEGITEALRTGPYGRCVYACDNDVVDHQVVDLLFEGGATASFTMTAFAEAGSRRTTVFGTRGELRGDGDVITRFDFLTDKTETIDTRPGEGAPGGHGGGDYGLMKGFIEAVKGNDPSKVLSGPQETLETHLMVFAAEKARKTGKVVKVS
jgi:predicted dehydrogenase